MITNKNECNVFFAFSAGNALLAMHSLGICVCVLNLTLMLPLILNPKTLNSKPYARPKPETLQYQVHLGWEFRSYRPPLEIPVNIKLDGGVDV